MKNVCATYELGEGFAHSLWKGSSQTFRKQTFLHSLFLLHRPDMQNISSLLFQQK